MSLLYDYHGVIASQGIGVYFFSDKIPLKAVCLEEKNHHKVKKVEEGREKRTSEHKLIRPCS
jgi:hypothetical protein